MRALRSRSLWDRGLEVPAIPALNDAAEGFDLAGPESLRLLAVARPFSVARSGAETGLVVVVAMDRRDLAESRSSYLRLLVPSLLALGLALALAMWIFVQQALAPFKALQRDSRAVHEGLRTNLPGGYPDEVRPLVDDLNRLIDAQERALSRARTQAGDMAHGLKTPLAVLSALARRTAAERPDIAREVDEQVLAMSRQVERSLARARVAATARLRRLSSPVAPVVAKLVATLRRLPDADSLAWEVSIPAGLAYPGEEGDLTEMLGNLLDNARKWAHRRVRITAIEQGADAMLRIEDDGPGMSDEAMSRIERGRRWDEATPGSGFGIAIASDIADATGASFTLSRSELGGLRAELGWPKVRTLV
jgi:signal transduction histidine kinase